MNKLMIVAMLSGVLCACGGSGGGTNASNNSQPQSATGSAGPQKLDAQVAARFIPNTKRTVAAGTSITIKFSVPKPSFVTAAWEPIFLRVADNSGILNPVGSTIPGESVYSLFLTTLATANPGVHQSNAVVSLCGDAACDSQKGVETFTLPVNINVLSASSAWPGNHLSALNAVSGAADWAMFQGNAAHTGYVPIGLDPNQFSARWEIQSTGSYASYSNPPISNTIATSNGRIFQASGTSLFARNEFDGSTAWQYDTSVLPSIAPIHQVNPPSVVNGTVYMVAGSQQYTYLMGFGATNGNINFSTTLYSQWQRYLAPTVQSGSTNVYIDNGPYDGLYGFTGGGTQLFSAVTDMTDKWTPAVDSTSVYTYTGGQAGGMLRIYNSATGALTSEIADPTFTNYTYDLGGAAVLGAPGSVFAANFENALLNGDTLGNTLSRFDTTTGTISWKIAGGYPTTPAYANGILYVANQNPMRLEARAETTGRLIWSWTPPVADTQFISEVLLTNDIAFVSTNNATYAIDMNFQQAVWSFPLSAKLALSKNGILYMQGQSVLAAVNLR